MSFLESVARDVSAVFCNPSEFAENRIVKYDGTTYGGTVGIPIVLEKTKQRETTAEADGTMLVSAVAYINAADLNGVQPEQRQWIEIQDGTAAGRPFFRRYRIITSSHDMGMITLELEAFDE